LVGGAVLALSTFDDAALAVIGDVDAVLVGTVYAAIA
jgi:hypothetical protein